MKAASSAIIECLFLADMTYMSSGSEHLTSEYFYDSLCETVNQMGPFACARVADLL